MVIFPSNIIGLVIRVTVTISDFTILLGRYHNGKSVYINRL